MSYLELHGTQRVLKPGPLGCTLAVAASGPAAGSKRSETLDVVGFDTATPQLISDFARGAL